VLLTVIAGLALAGCGAETVSLERAARAAGAVDREGSYRMSLEVAIEHPELGRPMVTKGSGEFDTKHKRGHMVTDLGSLAAQAGAPPGVDFELEFLLDDFVMYEKVPEIVPASERDTSGGKPWVKIDLRRAARSSGIALDQFNEMANSAQSIPDQLRGLTGDLERIGTEEVRGVETTRYKGTVDLRKLTDMAPPEARSTMRRLNQKMIDDLGGPTYPIELWIDGDDLLRRERHVTTKSQPGVEGKFKATSTSEFFDYGTEIVIKPPPEEDVHDLTDETEGLGEP
jgi:hypothetical protein